ncbi:retron Ec67 family RNA-directed DNA polymerase/endonuclease [Pantoea vagans]|uniref:retron Ec67 family RNA-directed DNA polymerase/endonuclease n=1 Tax=Pantoea vagans TaxID=470934 RepID=UPI003FA38627
MTALETLKKLKDLRDLAAFLDCKPKFLSYLLFFEKDKYSTFNIPKKSGGIRVIQAPNKKLKAIQKKLSDVLYECYSEIYPKDKFKVISHGFVKKEKINKKELVYGALSNAIMHKNKNNVLNIDLENYFGAFNFGRVRGFFIKNRDFSLSDKCATVIAQIACYDNSLPQGSPCSPIIANLITRSLDVKLASFSKKHSATYTRYVDDISISTNKKSFPNDIAINADNDISPGKKIINIISNSGFNINIKKTRLQYADSRQEVTGLVVNKFVNIPYEYRHNLRPKAHSLFNSNKYFYNDNDGNKIEGSIDKLNGAFSYIHFIRKNTTNKDKYIRDKNGELILDGCDYLYSQFLYYKYFAHNDRPLVICEGKTDVIYLKATLKTLAADYPDLIEVKDDKTSLKVQILPASKTVQDLLGLLTGTADLRKFILSYEDRLTAFKMPSMSNPVIVLVDNDDGPRKINSAIRDKYKLSPEAGKPLVIRKNLVYVRTPELKDKKDSSIEDFFSDGIRKIKIRGKTFLADMDDETTAHYGKKIFAEEVILQKRKILDFNSFKPILDLLVESIKLYKK